MVGEKSEDASPVANDKRVTMRIINMHQPVLAPISERWPMNWWFKKGSALFALILLGTLLGHGSAAGEVHTGHIDLVNRLEVDRFDIGQPFGLTSDPIAGTLLLLDGRTKELHTITTFSDRLATDQSNDIPAGAQYIEYDARSGTLLTFDPGQHQLLTLPWREGSNGGVMPGDSRTAVTTPQTSSCLNSRLLVPRPRFTIYPPSTCPSCRRWLSLLPPTRQTTLRSLAYT